MMPWRCVGRRKWDGSLCAARLGDVTWPEVATVDLAGFPSVTVKCRQCGTLNTLDREILKRANDQARMRVMA